MAKKLLRRRAFFLATLAAWAPSDIRLARIALPALEGLVP
jgi:hypothetical protein